ncbi:hypothetical protein F5148DRAFT_1298112 [Russula earlei]|uniref:Uncharacterized protein n=1 Tax=Russula earlei TaxID=71964 RepID=A0ACC0UHQ0_9AGAM|nr:hypothetical protein F5148DRAFT_1298112 [Russula earlei]
MSRNLRPRKARQSYLFHNQDEEPGPSEQRENNQHGDESGSDFASPAPQGATLDDDDSSDDGLPAPSPGDVAGAGIDSSHEGGSPKRRSKKSSSLSQGKAKARLEGKDTAKAKGKQKAKAAAPSATGLKRPASTATHPTTITPARHNYALPNPNIHHRHRPVPLFSGPTAAATAESASTSAAAVRVERLRHAPLLFAPNEIVPSNAYAANPQLTRRVGKGWGANVGPGPVWQMVEDLGWFREAEILKRVGAAREQLAGGDTATPVPILDERARRPLVYADVALPEGSAVLLRAEDGIAYLPTDGGNSASGGDDAAAPPIPCDFGPFGEQTPVNLRTLGTQKLSQFFPESRAHVFNAGASVWGLEWCPIHPDDRPGCFYKQYLIVAPLPSRTHSPEIGVKVTRPLRSCMQLWSLGPSVGTEGSGDDKGEMRCEMVLCIESGPALELKWCPLPSHDPLSEHSPATPRKLGLLAGIFEDGSLSVYAVPYPSDLAPAQPSLATNPVYVKPPKPILRIELEEAAFCVLDWGNSELMAAGLANGVVVVYNLGRALRSPSEPALPIGYYCVHQCAIRALAWVRVPDRHGNGPTVIASGGYDGLQCLTDIREPGGHVFNRTRDAINSVAYSPYLSAVVTIDHENTIKSYSLSPSTLGRGHALMYLGGPVWSVNASDYHPQLAVGSADGTCCTTNGLRSTRRGGYVPFLVHRVYQLDYSRRERRFRMLDHFKPREMAERPEGGGGAWHPSVGVQRVAWHNGAGLAATGLLASATGSGLCRVDCLEGRWFRDRIPYESVEAMRLEEDAMDVDVDEADDSN